MTLTKFILSTIVNITMATVTSKTGKIKTRLKTVDLLDFLISPKKIVMSEATLRIGLRKLFRPMASKELESTLFLRFLKTSGKNMEMLLESSRWERISMETLLTLDPIKKS